MFKKPIEFVIRAEQGNTLWEILSMIDEIKKAHPNAKICVEMEM